MTKEVTELPRNVSTDVIWNAVSFGVSAFVGVLINLLILRFYDASVLGVFNQVYVSYMILSQLAAGGFHLSLQTYISKHSPVREHASSVFESAFILGALQSLLVVLLIFPLTSYIGDILSSEAVGIALLYALPGLFFFTLNKMLLAWMNGHRMMKSFAAFRGLRFLIALVILLYFMFAQFETYWFPLCYSIAEIFLFLPLLVVVLRDYQFRGGKRLGKWMAIHWNFASRAFVGNLIMDVNGRVDVLMIGALFSDAAVGIYSFPSMLSEGLAQIEEVFRNNLNPVLTRAYFHHPRPVFARILKRGVKLYYRYLGGLSIMSLPGFLLMLWVFGIESNQSEMIWVFAILATGIGLVSGYLPVRMMFNQCGFAGLQTRLFMVQFIVNIVLNLTLIPIYGIYGAAAATSIAMLLQMILLRVMAKRHLNVSI